MLSIKKTLLLSLGILITGSVCFGQNLRQDYVYDREATYSPLDPIFRGYVYRTHIGHDGAYYNCDGEEEKRNSSFIRWTQRPCDDVFSLKRVRADYKQSLNDAFCRWQRGSCNTGDCQTTGMNYPPGAGYGNEGSQDASVYGNSRGNGSRLEPSPMDEETAPGTITPGKSEYGGPAAPALESVNPLNLTPVPAPQLLSDLDKRYRNQTPLSDYFQPLKEEVAAPADVTRVAAKPKNRPSWLSPPQLPNLELFQGRNATNSNAENVTDLPPINHLKTVPR